MPGEKSALWRCVPWRQILSFSRGQVGSLQSSVSTCSLAGCLFCLSFHSAGLLTPFLFSHCLRLILDKYQPSLVVFRFSTLNVSFQQVSVTQDPCSASEVGGIFFSKSTPQTLNEDTRDIPVFLDLTNDWGLRKVMSYIEEEGHRWARSWRVGKGLGSSVSQSKNRQQIRGSG